MWITLVAIFPPEVDENSKDPQYSGLQMCPNTITWCFQVPMAMEAQKCTQTVGTHSELSMKKMRCGPRITFRCSTQPKTHIQSWVSWRKTRNLPKLQRLDSTLAHFDDDLSAAPPHILPSSNDVKKTICGGRWHRRNGTEWMTRARAISARLSASPLTCCGFVALASSLIISSAMSTTFRTSRASLFLLTPSLSRILLPWILVDT